MKKNGKILRIRQTRTRRPSCRVASLCGCRHFWSHSARSTAGAADLNRTDIGPGGADFSGVEIGPDLGVALGTAGSANISGPVGGAHVGYNFQSNRIVGGVEGDVTFGSIRSGSLGSASFSQDFMSSARVKGGYVFGNLLAYGTLGWAWSTTDYKYLGDSSGQTVKGLAFGVGAEYPITRNVSLRGRTAALRLRRSDLRRPRRRRSR